jgi:hypothetical protein
MTPIWRNSLRHAGDPGAIGRTLTFTSGLLAIIAATRGPVRARGSRRGRPAVHAPQSRTTDPAENNYPQHAIRTGEHGLVWLATFQHYRPLALTSVEQRRLIPAPRSRLR